jgi:hypothetical protein
LYVLISCQSNSDKTIADQKAEIDSLKAELSNYKILHEIAKEIIEKDSASID